MGLHLSVSALRRGLPALVALIVAPAPARSEIPVVEVVDVIHAVSAAHVVTAIEKADAEGAPLLIVRLDTPGGYLSSMKQIIDKMLNCKTPVAVFVGPSGARGTSAGFLITIVADVAAMAPGTNIGAAHPVAGGGEKMDEVMSKKATSDTAAYIRGKVERRGRNVELAEKGVTPAAGLDALANGAKVRAAGSVIVRQRPGTAKGLLFLTLEDETGMCQAVVSPDLLQKHRTLIVGSPGLVVEGTLQKRDGTISIKGERFWSLKEMVAVPSHDFR